VNLGSRLEGANKLYATRIMLSETVANLVRGRFVIRQLDVLRVKGKQQPMPVFELIAEGQPNESTARRVQRYEEALHLYQRQRWNEAEQILVELLAEFPDDGPSKTLTKRIAQYRLSPPPAAWDGVYVAKEK
jgi:adenylate cyclase